MELAKKWSLELLRHFQLDYLREHYHLYKNENFPLSLYDIN